MSGHAGLEELRDLDARWAMPTYARYPIAPVRGEGTWLWDADDRRYLDFLTGISVCSTGHCHPRVVEAIREQAGRLVHTSNLTFTEPGLRLCERLARSSLGGRVFLANSGTEANEGAIKLVRRRAHGRGIERPEIVVLEGAFHGRTIGALAATPKMAREDLFGPLPGGFVAVPRDDPDALRAAVGPSTAAVILEPVQGESGVWPVPDEVIAAAREACDRSGALLVFDEIQAGMGRTGTLWAYEQTPAMPDVLTTAKAFGGGLPVGAIVTTPDYGEVLGRGDHGSTFAGGLVVAAAALAAFDVIDDPALLASVRELGARLRDGLAALEGVRSVRGRGLMVACEVDADATELQRALLGDGLLVNSPAPGTLRLLPPLVVEPDEVDRAIDLIATALARAGGGAQSA